MAEVWENCDNLIGMAECRNKWTDRVTSSQVVQKVELIHNPRRTTCHIDLLDSDILRLPSLLLVVIDI